MKRIVAILLVMIFALSCACAAEQTMIAPPDRASWPGESAGMMQVVNCEEWVSMRKSASTSAEVLAQIPLYGIVYNCSEEGDFYHCETSEGQEGYVLARYLLAPSFYLRTAADATADTAILTSMDEFSSGDIFEFWELAAPDEYYQVYCGRCAALYEDGEALRVSCFDGENHFVWGLYTASLSMTELNHTDAYMGGNSDRALVLVNNSDLGLVAIDLRTGEVAWTVDRAEVNLGASQAHAVSKNGTLYVGGLYGPNPVAISATGEVLWQSDPGENAVWLYEIQIDGDQIVAKYDAPDAEGVGVAYIDRKTGEVTDVEPIG